MNPTTALIREQAHRVYQLIAFDARTMDECEEGAFVTCWDDLHEWTDPNQYLVDVLGEDALADAIARDDMSEFDAVMVLVDTLLSYEPIPLSVA